MDTTVEDLLQDVDLTACLEQSPELEAPLFGNIFDELYLPDDLWKDVDKIPLLSETTTTELEAVSYDEKPKTTRNMKQPSQNTVMIPTLVNNGLQNIKTEVVQPSSCMINKAAIPAVPANVTVPTISAAVVAGSDKQGIKRSHPDSTVDMSQLSKKQQKMLKNRQSSSLSRQRKKEYVSTLEAQLSEAAQKNNALIKENEALRTKVKLLEKENQLLLHSKPQGLLTPPRTPAMLAIVLFVTVGLMLTPLRTMMTGSVEVEHESAPVKMHRALLSVEDDVTAGHHDIIQESHAVGPHLPDQLLTITTMEQMKSLHKAKKQVKKKVLKPVDPVNSTDTARLHTDLGSYFSSREIHPWYTGPSKTSAIAVVDHETQSPRVYSQDVLSFPYSSEKVQYFFKKSFTRNLETYYLVSFKDHLMFNAPLHNKTLFPKLSVMIPYNESSFSSEEDISMIQMDCSVIDTKLLTVKLPPDMS